MMSDALGRRGIRVALGAASPCPRGAGAQGERMNRTRPNPDAQLEASLRRISGALEHNRNQYAAMVEQIMAATSVEVAERVTARIAERHQRRMDRWQRREERRSQRRRYDSADTPRGLVSAAAAVVCLVFAVLQPELWWLVFVAFGFGMSAASTFGRAGRRRQAEREVQAEKSENTRAAEPARAGVGEREPAAPAAPAEPPDPRVTRIQSLCDKLLAELESGPPIVREVVTQPHATIGGLRQACLEIARRERELRNVLATQEEATLVADRDGLITRLSNEHDEIVRDRLGQALRALEQQLAHRAELATAATRLEAENTRILYTLENLRMQILRARSTDIGAPELGGKLRESLRELGTEIDAVAEALEWASAPGRADRGVVSPGTSDARPDAADTETAERLAAARRAAQAREAQRH
jgi:hypothetical protein